jgi:hypothetical protein
MSAALSNVQIHEDTYNSTQLDAPSYARHARGNGLSILLFSLRLISLPPLHNEKLEATSARVLSMGVSFRPDHETDSKITWCLQVLFGSPIQGTERCVSPL